MQQLLILMTLASGALLGQTPDHRIIVLLGPPGGGKGTQAERITAEYHIPSISTGDLLRAEVQRGSALGRQVQTAMQRGDLVSDAIVNQLVEARLTLEDARMGVILDGYPRTIAQARFLDELMKKRKLPAPIIINLAVPDDEIVRRLAARGRPDDKPETVRERLRVYAEETKPLLGYYGSKVREVTGTGEPGEVYGRVKQAIEASR